MTPGYAARFLVLGEDLPPIVASAFSVVGIASAAGAFVAWTHAMGANVTATTAAPAPSAPALALSSAPSASAAPGSSLAPAPAASAPGSASASVPGLGVKCPPLILGFNTESVYPSHAANPPLALLAKWLVAHPNATVVVDGHADSKGSDERNLRLSRNRAAFIGATLVGAGAPKARITIRAFVSYWPVDEAPPDASWNRRVVVQTKGDECPRDKEEVVEP